MRAFILLTIIHVVVSQMDYQDQVREDLIYKEMVSAGHWPDYKGLNE